MERMDMHSRNEYLKVLRESYFKVRTKKGKSQILDEYCCNTGQSRKYVITKIHKADLRPRQRKKRKERYNSQVKAALAKIWEIFDYPCGQRLKPLLETEVGRLSEFGEIEIPDPPLNPPYLARDVWKWILLSIVALLSCLCPMQIP